MSGYPPDWTERDKRLYDEMVGAPTPKPSPWTRERPTAQGWYWRSISRQPPTVVSLEPLGEALVERDGWAIRKWSFVVEASMLWSGPITPPPLPPEEIQQPLDRPRWA